MSGILQDIRYALRQLRKSPGFALVAVITLALGIGANTAIFSVVNGVLLRSLPFPDANRLVRVWHVPPAASFPGMGTFAVSAANYIDWEKQNHVFEKMTIYSFRNFIFSGTDKPEELHASSVSPSFFSTLGVQPMFGSVFTPEEDQPGRNKVVILSYPFWQEHFGSDRSVVGRDVRLDGENYRIAGVMPANFRIPEYAQMWTPMAWTDQERAVRGEHHYVVVARLKDGVELKQAQAELDTISSRLAQLYPADDKGWGAIAIPLRDDLVGDARPALLVLLGAVAFVLLIACVNVANLALAKTISRKKEIAIRTALGATSARVLRQVLTETIILSVTGGALGLICAHFGVRLIVAFLGDRLPRSADVGLDALVLLFTAVLSVLTGIFAGVLPALRLARGDVNDALKQGLGRTDSDTTGQRTRGMLVVSEVALSLMLLVGAGLMIRSFSQINRVNPGFDSHHVSTMTVSISQTKFATPAQQISFYERVLDRVRTLPGVQSAGVIDDIPLSSNGSHQPIAIEGQPVLPMSEQPEVDVRLVSPGYFGAMHTPVVRGRDFNGNDIAGRPETVVISDSFARHFWPNEDPIGKRLTLTFVPGVVREVVGVVGDVKLDSLNETRPMTTLYVPLGQVSASEPSQWRSFSMTLVARADSDPKGTISAIANAVHEIDPEVPLRDIMSMDDVVAQSVSPQRFNMLLLGAFAGLALLLAAVGIYSVLSYSVKRRLREIGVRLALGAQLRDVLRMVIFEGMKPTIVGVAIGATCALLLGRVLSGLIYGVSSADPITFFAVAVLLAGIALFASIIPAYRATRVDPMQALREE